MARKPGSLTTRSSPPDDPTTAWAKDVVAGRIVSGELAIAAAERHLRDLKDGPKRGLVWDPAAANRALGFLPAVLSITAGALEGHPFHPLPWHKFVGGSLFGWRRKSGRMRFRSAWLETGKGQAKALALDTPIPTPFGWTTMGDLKAGDAVFDDAGNVCRVIVAHPVVEGDRCYQLTFDDGAKIVANGGHLWLTEMRKSGSPDKGAATRGVKLSDRGSWRRAVRTTDEIAATLTYPNGQYRSANHSVPLCGPLAGTHAELPLHPYVLGAWLGDGDSDCARITIGDGDIDQMRSILAGFGVSLSERQRRLAYRMSSGAGRRNCLNINSILRSQGLFGNKHIPSLYLRASFSDRLMLLQGLMDTDGTIAADGQCCVGFVNENLAHGTHELALSLGLKASIHEGPAKLKGKEVGRVYRVRFYAPDDLPVFRFERKAEKQRTRHSRRRLSGERRIVACDPVPSVPVRCITVDSPSSMFLCGREMIPTHNSPFMAAIGIYLMGYYGIARSQVFSIGQDKATANVLFGDAVAMCRAPIPGGEDDDTLENRGEVIIRGEGDNAWKIEHPESGSVFRSLANGEAISGPRPTAVLADEIHEFKNNHSIETWKRAIAKMPGDAIMILGTNTPASTQAVGTAYSEFYQKVIRGEILDDELFGFIARVDKKDRERVFDDESCWQKALPALGVTFPIENIRGEVNTAKQLLSTALSVKRLYFGIPIGSTDFWIAEEAWSSVQGKVDPKAMRFQKCWLSLDLSQKNDLTALTAVWEDEDGHLHAFTWYWTTQEGLADRAKADQQPYEEWAADPKVSFTATPGAVIDKTFVAAKVKEICAQHDVQFLAFDVAGMTDFIAACEQIGFDVWKFEGPDKPKGRGLALVPHAQGKRRAFEDKQLTMPTSIERLEDRILNKTITIDASPVTYSCAANAQVDADGQGNRAFDKKRSRGRIDGLVTLAMAVGAVEFETDPAGTVEIFAL